MAGAVNDRKDRAMRERELGIREAEVGLGGPRRGRSVLGGTGGEAGGGYDGPISAATMPTGTTADYVRKGLIARGMDPHLADGFVLNIGDESNFNTSAVGDGGNAFGLVQWNGSRMRNLKAFAAEKGMDPSDADLQMDFLMHELNGDEAGAWGKIKGAKTAGEAGALIVNEFERPAEQHRARREAAYLAYGSGPAPAEAPPPAETPQQGRSVVPGTTGVAGAFGAPTTGARMGNDPLAFILGKMR